MTNDQKEYILRLDNQGISYREIGKLTGIPKSTVGRFIKISKQPANIQKNEPEEYTLTKAIPIPNRTNLIFSKMEIGHSFWVKKRAGAIYSQALSWCITNKKDWEFTTKKDLKCLELEAQLIVKKIGEGIKVIENNGE